VVFCFCFFFFNDTATTEIYTLSLHDALPICIGVVGMATIVASIVGGAFLRGRGKVWQAASIQPANGVAQLALLLAGGLAGVHVGSAWVLTSFYVGNAAACAVALVFLSSAFRAGDAAPAAPADPDAKLRSIFRFAGWMTVAALCDVALLLLPRVALVHISYREVAFFDLALIIYTIPQRITSALIVAIVPSAAQAQLRRERVAIPSRYDALALAAAVGLLDLVLWYTHALGRLLDAIGLERYGAAEGLFLIVLLAIPGQVLFGVNSGLLQAFGRSRTLALSEIGVLAASAALIPVAYVFGGGKYLAALVAVDYWCLYLVSRRVFDATEVTERSVSSWLLGAALRRLPRVRSVPARPAPER